MKTQHAWNHKDRVILHGDCVELMSRMVSESIDFVLTDPPYLCRYKDRSSRTILNDDSGETWLAPAYRQMYRLLKPGSLCLTFFGWTRLDLFAAAWADAGFSVIEHFVFAKSYASSTRFAARHHEQAYLLAKGYPTLPDAPPPSILKWQYTGNAHHPTQKPLCVLKPFIEAYTRPADIVFDPFCGSGSTILAAFQLGRRGIGIELDEQYVGVARQRIAA